LTFAISHEGKPNTRVDPTVAGYLAAYVSGHHHEKEWRDILAYIQSMPVKTPEERKQARREYMKVRDAQPEIRAKAAQCARQWRERNRERYNANARKWYAANRERARAAKYAWRDRNETELLALVAAAEATD
jgi:hypothetical protein